MRFSSAVVLAVVVALASSISAMPTDTSIGLCPVFCHKSSECSTCFYTKCCSGSAERVRAISSLKYYSLVLILGSSSTYDSESVAVVFESKSKSRSELGSRQAPLDDSLNYLQPPPLPIVSSPPRSRASTVHFLFKHGDPDQNARAESAQHAPNTNGIPHNALPTQYTHAQKHPPPQLALVVESSTTFPAYIVSDRQGIDVLEELNTAQIACYDVTAAGQQPLRRIIQNWIEVLTVGMAQPVCGDAAGATVTDANAHVDQSACSSMALHRLSVKQKIQQCSAAASTGVAEIDDAKAAAMARTIAGEKRIVCEDVMWDQINLQD
ncbi:hypothetical protein EV702DRAFT_1043732 [Suillus placidus]|uniref:Uncharacterized protein n=1 Tax=Suillus placidus TaxID=48579 RepID=A0A9P7A005_9AGAM|nr:hypothetical protein EV702DRAFT_1043732 [Suillus placidus]